MKNMSEISLNKNEQNALTEFKQTVASRFPQAEIILYGSKARGDSTLESDIDLLVVLPQKITGNIEQELSVLQLHIEIKYDVIIGLFAENRDEWRSPRNSITPLHQNIENEGVLI